MGLDAHVHCNCIRQGLAPPHPSPDLLAFEESGNPILISNTEMALDQWLAHDAWLDGSCPHSGYLIRKRLGNIALVAYIRKFIEEPSATDLPILTQRVVYSGTHCGDQIVPSDASLVLKEAGLLAGSIGERLIQEFAQAIIELAQASIATGNPIVF